MELTWVGCAPGNAPNVAIRPVGVFLHWMASTLAGCDSRFLTPGEEASTTYGVSGDIVHQYVPEGYASYHCGAAQNYTHMAIELEGWPGNPPSEETRQTAAEIAASMSKRYGWGKLVHTSKDDPECNVWEHRWVSATACPGETDIDDIVRRANIILGYEEDDMIFDEYAYRPLIPEMMLKDGTANTSTANCAIHTELNTEQILKDVQAVREELKNLEINGAQVDYDKLADAVADKMAARLKE